MTNYSLLLQNRSSGKIYDLGTSCKEVTFSTKRTGQPAKLEFDVLKTDGLAFFEGDPVRLTVDGVPIFYGYVFTKEKDRWGSIKVTAYDQTRYLLAKQAYRFTGATAEQIIQRIAKAFNLNVGSLAATNYKIPYLDFGSGRSCLDIIQTALQQVTINTGKVFVFYDDFGALALKESGAWRSSVVVGSGSLVTDYTYKTDIDSDTYNQVKLVRPNSKTGKADVFEVKDSSNIAKWGLLQYYDQVDESANTAQIKSQAKTMLAYFNRVLRTLSIESLGVPGVRAGQMIFIDIPDLGDIALSKFVMLESVEHTFESDKHTMKLETRALTGW